MNAEQARALFLDQCQPGDRGALERHGEKAAVAAILTAVESFRDALHWALPLAERAVDDHRMERLRCGHSHISGTYKNGVTYAGIYQTEVERIESARAILARGPAS